jgi:hypothetical protein
MDHLQDMGSNVEKGPVLQPQVDMERNFIEIAGSVKSDVVVSNGNLRGCKTMGGNQGRFLKIAIATDVIEMFMGIDNDIDIPDLQAQKR